jgi:hypothetical protein
MLGRLPGNLGSRFEHPNEQFQNVPDRLTIFVRDHMQEFKKTGDRNFLYLEAAEGVIREYLEINVFDPAADRFWGAETINPQGDLWYGHPLRVILVGESLFLLRSCKGFSEICRRLKTRNLRSAYYEMLAAKAFYRAGFGIDMRPESGERGSDFDFIASRHRLTVNVEVTALEEKDFYERTAINALNHKRRQLPDDKPAVIFVIIPAKWETSVDDINQWTASVANEFFIGGSRRINIIVFQVERHIDTWEDKSRGGFIVVSKVFEAPNPRFPCNLNGVFAARGDAGEMQLRMETATSDPVAIAALANQVRQGEFFEWVDSLVP